MEHMDIIRHEPGSSPTVGRQTPVHGRAEEPAAGFEAPKFDLQTQTEARSIYYLK